MNWRGFILALIACLTILTLAVAVIRMFWPAPTPMPIDGAYTAQFRPKPIILRPKPPAPPKHHRLKTNLERFNRFEFDQRAIV